MFPQTIGVVLLDHPTDGHPWSVPVKQAIVPWDVQGEEFAMPVVQAFILVCHMYDVPFLKERIITFQDDVFGNINAPRLDPGPYRITGLSDVSVVYSDQMTINCRVSKLVLQAEPSDA